MTTTTGNYDSNKLAFSLVAFGGLCVIAASIMTAMQEIPPISAKAQEAMPAAWSLAAKFAKDDQPKQPFSKSISELTDFPGRPLGIHGTPDDINQDAYVFARLLTNDKPTVLNFGPNLHAVYSGYKTKTKTVYTEPWTAISVAPINNKSTASIRSVISPDGGATLTLSPLPAQNEPYVLWAMPISAQNGNALSVGTSTIKDFEDAIQYVSESNKRIKKAGLSGLGGFFLMAIGLAGFLINKKPLEMSDSLKKRRPRKKTASVNGPRIAPQ